MEAAGWTRLPLDRFSASLGPVWVKGEPGNRVLALHGGERVVNDYGRVVHGGALMTFVDIALGLGASDAIPGQSYVTVQLQYQFASGAPAGCMVTCEPELVRRTSQLAFVRGLVKADGATVGSVEAIFKALGPR